MGRPQIFYTLSKKEGANVKGYYWLTGKVRLGDEVVEVGVTIREDNNGNPYYNHNILKSETPQNSEFKPLTKQALEQRGYDEDQSSSFHNDSLNLFVRKTLSPEGSFSPSANAITLTPNADLSTFSHELGHWYLANLLELSKLDGASASFQEDARAILKEFGLGKVQEWDALGLEDQRKYHERFACWTEIYFATGKAPVSGLRKFFDRLGAWICNVYRAMKRGVEGVLGPAYEQEFGETR